MTTRTAIIISCPSKGEKYLRGAEKDLRNMKNHLMSPRGGLWYDREIFCLTDPSWREVKMLLSSLASSYQFIYFAGHGCGGKNSVRYIEFKDRLVEDKALITIVQKQLIVIDACRVYYAAIGGISPTEEYLNFTGESARTTFDRCIEQSPNGRIIVHATRDKAEAAEERCGRGGAFTLSLLMAALNFKTGIAYCPIGIKELLPKVEKILRSEKYEQIPEIAYEKGDLRVPFLIDTEQVVMDEEYNDNMIVSNTVYPDPPQKISLGAVIVMGLVVFALFKKSGN